jgi:hypothetical protein
VEHVEAFLGISSSEIKRMEALLEDMHARRVSVPDLDDEDSDEEDDD